MTGWQIIGACVLAAPILTLLALMALDDPEACFVTVVVMTLIIGSATLGALLITGAWSP